jgi:hypothetical protein
MTCWLRLAVFVVLAFSKGAPAQAHHSTAAYAATTITLKGAVVKRLAWTNPNQITLCLCASVARRHGKIGRTP